MNHVSTLKLHQLRLGELPAHEARHLRDHVDVCALCRSRHAHQLQTRSDFESMPTPLALSRPRWHRAVTFAAPLLAAAMVLVLLRTGLSTDGHPAGSPLPAELPAASVATPEAVPRPDLPPGPASEGSPPPRDGATPSTPGAPEGPATPAASTTRTKGATMPRVEAWVMSGESERPLYDGEVVGEGTRVQLRYDSLGRRYATFAGRDGNGVVEVYATVANEARGLATAPFALTLDGTLGQQVFYVFLSDHRPSPGDVNSALAHTPVRMRGAIVTSLTVQKD